MNVAERGHLNISHKSGFVWINILRKCVIVRIPDSDKRSDAKTVYLLLSIACRRSSLSLSKSLCYHSEVLYQIQHIFYSRGVSFLKWEGCQNCNNKKVEQIIIGEKENGQKLRHYWSAVRRSREWNKPLFMRKYAVCAFTPSPCIKRIWLQKPVKSKDFLTVIPFGKKGMSNRT